MLGEVTISLIRARYLLAHVHGYERLGGRPERLLQRINVPPRALDAPDSLLPLAQVNEFVRLATQDTGFALAWYAAPQELASLGAFGNLLSAEPTLYGALSMFVRAVKAESSGTTFFLEERPGVLWVCRGPVREDERLGIHVERFALQTLLTIIRHWAGQRWFPTELWLRSTAIPEDDQLRPIARVRYRAPILALPVPCRLLGASVDPRPITAATFEEVDLDDLDLLESISRVLEIYLPAGRPTLARIAETVGTSVRSLQRRLDDVGTTHSRLLDDVRRKMALARLEQGEYPITAIAHDLGYSDSAHFARAFQRWTGVSPTEYRRLRQSS